MSSLVCPSLAAEPSAPLQLLKISSGASRRTLTDFLNLKLLIIVPPCSRPKRCPKMAPQRVPGGPVIACVAIGCAMLKSIREDDGDRPERNQSPTRSRGCGSHSAIAPDHLARLPHADAAPPHCLGRVGRREAQLRGGPLGAAWTAATLCSDSQVRLKLRNLRHGQLGGYACGSARRWRCANESKRLQGSHSLTLRRSARGREDARALSTGGTSMQLGCT